MIIKKDPDAIRSYFEDSSNLKGGHADELAIPESVDELYAFLAAANDARRPVTISGGGTSTTGSRVPYGGVIVSLERLAGIVSINEGQKSITARSGALVDDVKKAAEARKLFYTSHPTERSATLGGTVATNASGARSFKYGPTRDYVRALTMVFADGRIARIRRGDRTLSRGKTILSLGGREFAISLPTYRMPDVKNAAGYYAKEGMDLIDLFIGQEGTLSVITEVELALATLPERIFGCFSFFTSEEDAWDFADAARSLSRAPNNSKEPGIDALSIEYFDHNALAMLKIRNAGIPERAFAAIFFEQEAHAAGGEALDEWARLMERHNSSIDDAWVALTERDLDRFTAIRHSIPDMINDSLRRRGVQKSSTDIAVPDGRSREMIEYYSNTLRDSGLEHAVFGHIGESHLHVNVIPRGQDETARARTICATFVRKGIELGGTVSAEHGIGKIKHAYLKEMYGSGGIAEMVQLKRTFDPNCILGLDNIFPKELLA